MTDPRSGKRDSERFTGSLLMACGGLIAGLCGLCTLALGGGSIVAMFYHGLSADNVGGAFSMVLMAAIIGGIPTLIGVWLFWIGRRIYRGDARPLLQPRD